MKALMTAKRLASEAVRQKRDELEAADSGVKMAQLEDELILAIQRAAKASVLSDIVNGMDIKALTLELLEEMEVEMSAEDSDYAERMLELAGEQPYDFGMEDATQDVEEELARHIREVEERKEKLEKLIQLRARFAAQDSTAAKVGGETNMKPADINAWYVSRTAKRQREIERVLA